MITPETEYYTVAEAARLLHVSVPTVWRWIDSGRVPADRIGARNIRIKRFELDRLIQPARTRIGHKGDADKLIARLKALHDELLAKRGGKPFESSVPLIHEARDERMSRL